MNTSKEIRQKYGNEKLWQRGFYDHIIRNREDYEDIERYVYKNPKNWHYDKLYKKREI